MDALTRFIHRTGGEPWVYGWSDCAPWVLRWVTQRTGKTASVPRYDSRLGALRLIRVHGGTMPLYQSFASSLGLATVGSPQRGDVAVVSVERSLTGQTGAISVSPGKWAVKFHSGKVKIVEADHLIVWQVPDTCSAPRQSPC